jgi:two-component system chemotaxis sensor kinase CheA
VNPLLQQFLVEARDFLEQIGQKLLLLEETPDDEAIIGEIFRFVHTLKGNSGLFDMPSLTSVVHAAEDILDRVREHSMSMDAELTDTLLEATDFIATLLDDIEDAGVISAPNAKKAASFVAALRRHLPEREEPSFADGAAGVPAQQIAAPDWLWLEKLDEAERLAAFEAYGVGPGLAALRYEPEKDCFFKGEDPVLLMRNLPGLIALSIAIDEDWPEAAVLDVYRSNFVFDALCAASREEIDHHLRYVSEQTAVYSISPFALALPQGQPDHANGAMIGTAFVEEARTRLAAGDLAGLLAAAQAALDIMNPQLRSASALRWLCRLIGAGADAAAIGVLLAHLTDEATPNWQAFASASAAGDGAGLAPAAAGSGTAAPPVTPILPSEDLDVWRDLVLAQKNLLTGGAPAGQRSGRLRSVRNTLASLLHAAGAGGRAAELEMAFGQVSPESGAETLIAFIDTMIAQTSAEGAAARMAAPSLAPDLELLPAIPMPVAPVAQPALALAEAAPGPGVSEPMAEPADGGRRGNDPQGGVRVLKVPQEKVDRLMDLIGEMVVAKNALPYLAARAEDHFGSRDLSREIKAQYSIINRIAEEMQDGIMQVRMLPVGAVFQRFPRLVRDVARQLGKVVRLVVEGEETEADKNIVESLSDPMIHILRNSLDHGLEAPQARRAAGKPEEARLTVRASQEGDRVLIEIEDDGKGIDPAVIRRKAFEKGLIDEQRLETLSDVDAVQLVFAPGFSTADQISNLSGRGVGMDVVKSSLEKVGGQVHLTSETGKGTRILLSLPLSMSVSNVMMVYIGEQQFGVPMDAVVETVRVAHRDIHIFKDQRTAVLRGRIVPLYDASTLLKTHVPPQPNADDEYAILVVRIHDQTVGIIVDGFAQTIDVILKPLEGPLAHLTGFSGSALLGDGSVLLVLNLKELI